MPLKRCKINGKSGWKWGNQKCYPGKSGKARALRQARAIEASKKRRGVVNAARKATNPLKIDPSKTASLRRQFSAELARRFARLRLLVADLVEKEDAFGLGVGEKTIADLMKEPKQAKLILTDNTRWRFLSTPDKVQQFAAWLRTQIGTMFRGQTVEQLWRRYIEQGFRKGAGRAFDDTRRSQRVREEGRQPLGFYEGTRDEFLRSAFAQPVALEKVQLLAGRGLTDLAGVTEQMATVMTRTLTDGLVRGASPREVARDLMKNVDGIGRVRAEMIARSELIRAHAEGTLTAMEQLGVTEVNALVEWTSTPDSRRCSACAALEGVVLKISEARGLIPRHVSCRCAWTPANVGESTAGQKRTAPAIRRAVEKSTRAAGDDFAVEVSGQRPKGILNMSPELIEFSRLIANAFCPTGKGGGVDPSCSPGGGGGGIDKAKHQARMAELDKAMKMAEDYLEGQKEFVDPSVAKPLTAAGRKTVQTMGQSVDRANLSPEKKKAYKEAVERVAGNMPDRAHQLLQENLKGAHFYDGSKELSSGIYDRIQQQMPWYVKIGDKVLGGTTSKMLREQFILQGEVAGRIATFYETDGTVHLDGPGKDAPVGVGQRGYQNHAHVYAHELTHAIDRGGRFSNTTTWQRIWSSEINTPDSPLTRYATTNPAEGFAEIGRALYGGGIDRNEVERRFPQAAQYLRQEGLWPA